MTLKKITIKNIKGIQNHTFDFEIIPNKPSILVGQNGFGKSSFAVAFKSMNQNRIALEKLAFHKEDQTLIPSISIEFINQDSGITSTLFADNSTNNIAGQFDWFVINNPIRAKGISQSFSGKSIVTASLHIDPITLIDKIPDNVKINYSYTNMKSSFGKNGKILINIAPILDNQKLMTDIQEQFDVFSKAKGNNIKIKIKTFIDSLNSLTSNTEDIIDWIENNKLVELKSIKHLSSIADFLANYDLGIKKESIYFLVALQLIKLFEVDEKTFKNHCKRKEYEYEKTIYKQLFSDFSTWKNISPVEYKGSLILEFPKAHLISNGQRDVICILALIKKAEIKLKKKYNILILDEIFDYLDDANLIAVQYYLTKLIEKFVEHNKINQSQKRFLYPLILTHLNPNYFRTFAFSDQKTYYLNKSKSIVNQWFIKLIKHRNDKNSSIKDDISRFMFHYHPQHISKRTEFKNYGLKETWGEGNNFDLYLNDEINKYLKNDPHYDPFAVCCAVRKRIEQNIYQKISEQSKQTEFLNTNSTKSKLEYASSIGVLVPETYYMLGIIYNDAMHWNERQPDNISPTASKLENLVIKKLIEEVFTR